MNMLDKLKAPHEWFLPALQITVALYLGTVTIILLAMKGTTVTWFLVPVITVAVFRSIWTGQQRLYGVTLMLCLAAIMLAR